jgi:uncharacterized protein YbaP (TraB family)
MKNLKFLFGVLFIWNTALAQENSVREFPMEDKSLLWQISGPNVKGDAYLFGTMHLIQRDFFHFPKKLEKLVKKSDVLVMELPGLPDPSEAMSYVLLEEGTFFDFFSAEQIDSILVWAREKMNFEEAAFRTAFSKLKPFAIVQLAVQMHFIGKTESYEISFESLANENDVPIEGLETVAEQMSIFDNLTDKQQSEMVMESIREGDKSIKTLETMQRTFADQDIDGLYQLIHNQGGVIESEEKQFLDDRNRDWIPKLKAYLAAKNSFIAVGAAHLGGPNGLIRLLEKEGYTLTPVKL